MSSTLDDFIDRARAVTIADAATRLGVPERQGEWQGPCPRCGGKDRFGVNRAKGAWVCRGCGAGGKDAIGLAAHMHFHDLKSRSGFLCACGAALGEAVPAEGERETDDERAAREARMAAARDRAAKDAAAADRKQNAFREREINQARGLYLGAEDCLSETHDGLGRATIAAYLRARTGFDADLGIFDHLRFRADCTYWHGRDAFGRPKAFFSGPAMIAPFVDPAGRVIGCHQTWIDLDAVEGKFRPVFFALTDEGLRAGRRAIADGRSALPPSADDLAAGYYERLTTKKMRGSKKGGLIPVFGDPQARRWVVGEGIETVFAIAAAEAFRDDTFYAAAGDIGNLAGPAEPRSAFDHPTLVTEVFRRPAKPQGRTAVATDGAPGPERGEADSARTYFKKVRIQGPVPRPGQGPEDALQVPDHVADLVLLADGDSEIVFTAAAMARAEDRLGREGRAVATWWPPDGLDFAEAAKAARDAEEVAAA